MIPESYTQKYVAIHTSCEDAVDPCGTRIDPGTNAAVPYAQGICTSCSDPNISFGVKVSHCNPQHAVSIVKCLNPSEYSYQKFDLMPAVPRYRVATRVGGVSLGFQSTGHSSKQSSGITVKLHDDNEFPDALPFTDDSLLIPHSPSDLRFGDTAAWLRIAKDQFDTPEGGQCHLIGSSYKAHVLSNGWARCFDNQIVDYTREQREFGEVPRVFLDSHDMVAFAMPRDDLTTEYYGYLSDGNSYCENNDIHIDVKLTVSVPLEGRVFHPKIDLPSYTTSQASLTSSVATAHPSTDAVPHSTFSSAKAATPSPEAPTATSEEVASARSSSSSGVTCSFVDVYCYNAYREMVWFCIQMLIVGLVCATVIVCKRNCCLQKSSTNEENSDQSVASLEEGQDANPRVTYTDDRPISSMLNVVPFPTPWADPDMQQNDTLPSKPGSCPAPVVNAYESSDEEISTEASISTHAVCGDDMC